MEAVAPYNTKDPSAGAGAGAGSGRPGVYHEQDGYKYSTLPEAVGIEPQLPWSPEDLHPDPMADAPQVVPDAGLQKAEGDYDPYQTRAEDKSRRRRRLVLIIAIIVVTVVGLVVGLSVGLVSRNKRQADGAE